MVHAPTIQGQIADAVRQRPAFSGEGLLEALFSRLFLDLVYPQIWEDPVADMGALGLGPEDDVVCIASGGCNVLSYLTAGPASVTAVDLSPAHVALVRLKLAAARHLPGQPEFFGFFGDAARPENPALYDRFLAPRLDPATRAYWEARPLGRRRIEMFARGFYRHGLLGRFLGAVHLLARLGGVDLRDFLRTASLDEQRHFFETRLVPLIESRAVRFLVRRRASLFGLGIPPAQYGKLAADGGGDVLPVLRERARKLACDFLLRDNYFAWQAFGRGYDPGPTPALPPYLQASRFETVRQGAPRAEVLNRSLSEVLADAPAGSRSAFVLLDAQDWMSDAQLHALWAAMTRAARPGARVIFRTGGAADILPGRVAPGLLGLWEADRATAAACFAADRSAIYGGFHLYRRR